MKALSNIPDLLTIPINSINPKDLIILPSMVMERDTEDLIMKKIDKEDLVEEKDLIIKEAIRVPIIENSTENLKKIMTFLLMILREMRSWLKLFLSKNYKMKVVIYIFKKQKYDSFSLWPRLFKLINKEPINI